MEEKEGVIKYRLVHTDNNRVPPQSTYLELESWRQILFQLKFLGQDPDRYGGLGYGNISIRNPEGEIWVSGSQTSGHDILQPNQYAYIQSATIETNELISEGNIKPSSEAMSHMALYQASASIQAIVHIHEPTLWRYGQEYLGLPETDEGIAYGTPEMAKALQSIAVSQNCVTGVPVSGVPVSGVIVMKGHKDGVIAYGDTLKNASLLLISLYQKVMKVSL